MAKLLRSNIKATLAATVTTSATVALAFSFWQCYGAAAGNNHVAAAADPTSAMSENGNILRVSAPSQLIAQQTRSATSYGNSGSDGTSGASPAIPINSDTIADIAQQAAPSVVNIEVRRKDESLGISNFDFDMPNFGGGTFKFFYNGRQVTPGTPIPIPKISPKARKASATGSGFVIRQDGYILTNAHLVKGASEIRVSLNDKRSFDATIVGTDSFSDLAVLRINAGNLPALKLGSSEKLRPGEFAIAIGSPLGFDHTVTLGIISAIGRTITDINGNINFIQTDAAINPGNSGGPLLNFRGEAVGVNTAIQANAQNIGFSIPNDVARNVAEDLIKNGSISRPWLGIGMSELTEAHVKSLGVPATTRGVFVRQVFEGSPAQQAGIESGDIIQKIEGKTISGPRDVQEIVKAHRVNEKLNFLILRGATSKPVEVTIGQYPDLAPSQSPSKSGDSNQDPQEEKNSEPDSGKK